MKGIESHMRLVIRFSIGALLASSFATAQEPADPSKDTTIQALLKEVHALRIAMEQTNQIGPRIQIILARIQLQEERVRNATRELQDARDRLADTQTKKTELADRARQLEMPQHQSTDPNARRQMDFELAELKATVERMGVLEQQLRVREAEANSLLVNEQGRWNEANNMLTAIAHALATAQK
jgi:hypothetical protein